MEEWGGVEVEGEGEVWRWRWRRGGGGGVGERWRGRWRGRCGDGGGEGGGEGGVEVEEVGLGRGGGGEGGGAGGVGERWRWRCDVRTGIKSGIKKKLEQQQHRSCPCLLTGCVSTQPGLLHLLVKLRREEISPGSFPEGFAGSARLPESRRAASPKRKVGRR